MEIGTIIKILLTIVCAMTATSLIHPRLVKLARSKHFVDKPNYRKLNKVPIPVLGGFGVFASLVVTFGVITMFFDSSALFVPFTAMSIMAFTGLIDDGVGLSARSKSYIQTFAVCILIFGGGLQIDNLHGLWGVYELPQYISIPLTIIACVGLINAVNLIDGVDGLSSGFGILTSVICGVIFFLADDIIFALLAAAVTGALIPFFRHNVYGSKYKMFMGDCGSLVLGVVCCIYAIRFLQFDAFVLWKITSPVSLTIAIFAIPIFDTLRVMLTRILHGRSPFSPDKNHIHHMFINFGFSHVNTAINILILNTLVVLTWGVAQMADMSNNAEFFLVTGMAMLVTWGTWFYAQWFEKKHPTTFQFFRKKIIRKFGRR